MKHLAANCVGTLGLGLTVGGLLTMEMPWSFKCVCLGVLALVVAGLLSKE
jgi:hypothetical protein